MYVLLKELVWESVDMAWCAKEVSMWEAGDIPVPASSDQQSKGGQSESDPTQPVMGGQGISTSTTSKVKKRNKLPGISATQKSVADFFVKNEYPVSTLPVIPHYSLCEVCDCPADRCDCVMCVPEVPVVTGPGTMKMNISQDNSGGITRRESNVSTDMRIVSMRASSPAVNTTSRIISPSSSSGEEFSSEMLTEEKGGRGVSRQPTINEFVCPSSKKIIRKMKSVTETLSEEHALYLSQSQNWRQKLERFKPDKS